jgi:polynucleotide 5'-triphosphatase
MIPKQARSNSPPPLKRARRAPSPTHSETNGHASSTESPSLPPLSLSILGIEPLDEFIKEIADFVHHMIMTRPDHLHGKVEVEAKIGILRDRMSGQRLALPVLVETSICGFPIRHNYTAFVDWLSFLVLAPDSTDVQFESNMSIVRFFLPISQSF